MAEAAPVISEEQLEAAMDQILSGGSLAAARGITQQDLEAIYSVAYTMYGQGKYEQASNIFRFLSMYDHRQPRFWMGLAGCMHHQKKYQDAIAAYTAAVVCDIEDPTPQLHMADCFMAIDHLDGAEGCLEGAIHFSGDRPEYAQLKSQAEALLHLVQKRKEGAGS